MHHSTSDIAESRYWPAMPPLIHSIERTRRVKYRMTELVNFHISEVARVKDALETTREEIDQTESYTEEKYGK